MLGHNPGSKPACLLLLWISLRWNTSQYSSITKAVAACLQQRLVRTPNFDVHLRTEYSNSIKHINHILKPRPGKEKGNWDGNTWLLPVYEVSGKSATFQNQSISVPAWQMAGRHREGNMQFCQAPCRLQSWLGLGRKTEGCVFLCTFCLLLYYYCCSKHNHSKEK